jgi:hypothetical protein
VTPTEKPQLHLRIGRLLLARHQLPADFERVVTLADDELMRENVQNMFTIGVGGPSISTAVPPATSPSTTISGTTTSSSATAESQRVAGHSGHGRPFGDKEGSTLMDVVRHLNQGQLLVMDPNERWRFAKLNCYLAHRTRESTAFQSALTFSLYAMLFLAPHARVIVKIDKSTINERKGVNDSNVSGDTDSEDGTKEGNCHATNTRFSSQLIRIDDKIN